MANRVAYANPMSTPGGGLARQEKVIGDVVALVTGDLALNNTVSLFKVPAGFVLTGLSGRVDDLDSNGTPTIQFQLGDAGSAARILAASTKAQAGATFSTADMVAAAIGYEFTAETEILMTTSTASATAQAGNIAVYLHGYMKYF